MRTVRVVGTACLLVPVLASAQQAPSTDSVPRAGEWGVEAAVTPSTTGASLLRFRSPTFAWLLGADFNFVRHKNEFTDPTFGVLENSVSLNVVTARLGGRSYRPSATERLRPVVGGGVLGSYYRTSTGNSRQWKGGVYGELGAVYFVASHVSLGGTAELQAAYAKETRDSGASGRAKFTSTSVGGSLARLLVSVYF